MIERWQYMEQYVTTDNPLTEDQVYRLIEKDQNIVLKNKGGWYFTVTIEDFAAKYRHRDHGVHVSEIYFDPETGQRFIVSDIRHVEEGAVGESTVAFRSFDHIESGEKLSGSTGFMKVMPITQFIAKYRLVPREYPA